MKGEERKYVGKVREGEKKLGKKEERRWRGKVREKEKNKW